MRRRGLWNLYINGKWYRFYRPSGPIRAHESTLKILKDICAKLDNLEGWEPVPFPTPIHADISYICTIDIDADCLEISSWKEFHGSLAPSIARMELAKILGTSSLIDHMVRKPHVYTFSEHASESNVAHERQFETLEIDYGIPSPMNELQERFFIDLVFIWRFYIDDPSTWSYDSPVFRILSVAFLRLAAWDFEVSFDCNVNIPTSLPWMPLWSYPDTDVYWFHGFLIVLQDDLETTAMVNGAVSKAQLYLGNSRVEYHDVRLIIISPRRLVFVELSCDDVVTVSRSQVLLSNYSATQCSPGFRALARVLTSNCWKKPYTHREKWPIDMPPEIIQMILDELEPRDAVAFSQASFAAEKCYYASIPQFKDINVRSFKLSIPCCGKSTGIEKHGISCSECHSWQHFECIGLEAPSGHRWVCTGCQERACLALDPGGINRLSGGKEREGCQVGAEGLAQSLQLRLSKSVESESRPERRGVENVVPSAPSLKQYAIRFNHAFTGLDYGLEDSS